MNSLRVYAISTNGKIESAYLQKWYEGKRWVNVRPLRIDGHGEIVLTETHDASELEEYTAHEQ